MATNFDQVQSAYQRRAASERHFFASQGPDVLARRDEFLLEIGLEAARLVQALIIGGGANQIVEIGTSYGYSTLFLAEAARQTGGRVTTFELSADKQAYAREQIGKAGLAQFVDWRCGDAVQLLQDLDGPLDFVLIDLWKDLYVPCLEAVYPKLSDGAVIVADNMIHPVAARGDAAAYRAAIRSKPDLRSVLLPIGSGVEVSCVCRENG